MHNFPSRLFLRHLLLHSDFSHSIQTVTISHTQTLARPFSINFTHSIYKILPYTSLSYNLNEHAQYKRGVGRLENGTRKRI